MLTHKVLLYLNFRHITETLMLSPIHPYETAMR